MTSSKNAPYARDLGLVRDILLWLEAGCVWADRPCAGDEPRLYYHIMIMRDAGLVTAAILTDSAPSGFIEAVDARVTGITPDGHDMLQVAHTPAWQKSVDALKDAALPALPALALEVARQLARNAGILP